MKKIGFITIGQSPRTDVIKDIRGILGGEIEIVECGVLDDVTSDEIKKMGEEGDNIYVTRLRDGTPVKISVEMALVGVYECVKKLDEECHIIVILCTGDFPNINSRRIIIESSKLLKNMVYSIVTKGKIGVVIPSEKQVDMAIEKWRRSGIEPLIEVVSPYEEIDENKILEISKRFREAHVNLIILDCIGYSYSLKRKISSVTNLPVLLPRTIIARTLKELLDI